MKQIVITALLCLFFSLSQNALCDSIIWSNCPDFVEDEDCMNLRYDLAIIDILIDLPPYMQNTTWKVQFSTSTDYEFINYNLFRQSPRPDATHEYNYALPIESGNNTYVFIVYLFDEANNLVDMGEVMTFNLCEAYASSKLSVNNGDISQTDKNNKNIEFGNLSLLNQQKVDYLNVFPNPFEEDFTIEYYATQNETKVLEIFDISGKKIFEETVLHSSPGIYQKNINDLMLFKGVYFCKFQSDKNQNFIRLLKTR